MSGASDYWNRWQEQHASNTPRWVDWGEHPRVLAHLYRELFGAETTTVFDFFKSRFPQWARAQAISLCSGDGSFERLLVEQGVFGSVQGVDLAAERVAAANAQCGALADRLSYAVADANLGDFGHQCYDIVFAKAALHHIENLDALFAGMRRCLRPGGQLVTIDFFGPTRFQWTPRQLEAVNRFITEQIPPRLRQRADGTLFTAAVRPTVEQLVALDPSEAVRSSELYALLQQQMQLQCDFAIGGTLLNLILDASIVNNFALDDAQAMALIDQAFALEREMMQRGEIGCDFRLIVAHFPEAA
jgi:ubiquinone/menaquinone biosynthesis C-methylase UbiE